MPKILVLISELAEDRAFASEVANTAGLTIEKFSNPKDAMTMVGNLPGDEPVMLIADVTTLRSYLQLETAIQESVGLLSDKINSNHIHFITSENFDSAQYLTQSPLFGHFILRNYGDAREAGRHYGRIVKASLAERAFGLKRIFRNSAKIQEVKLTSSAQKQGAVEAIKNYLISAKFQSRMATVIANAVDELLMNAIFDAPVDEMGNQLYSNSPRNAMIKFEGQHIVEMHVAYDSQYVAVTAVDTYGSLDKARLISSLAKSYLNEEYKVKAAQIGAGIGLSAQFRLGASFFFVAEPRTRTEATVIFKRTDSFREFKDQFRFLSTQFYF